MVAHWTLNPAIRVQASVEPFFIFFSSLLGLSPILSLQTSDGAVLNGEDVLGLILQDGDKVVGDMVKWDLQPLPERYANLCRQLEIGWFYFLMEI